MNIGKWAWVLALPYALTISTQTFVNSMTELRNDGEKWSCEKPVPQCLDWAEALNEAHARRTRPPTGLVDPGIIPPIQYQYGTPGRIDPNIITLQSFPVCGADDCGKLPSEGR